VATKKQRRRREKEQRHDYEVVYLDSEGNEVDPEEVQAHGPPKRNANGKSSGKSSSRSGSAGARGRRVPQPPSWRRVAKRGAIFAPLFIATVLLLGGKNTSLATAFVQTLVLLVLFIPFSYFLDSLVWRSHLKRTGGGTSVKR
jgi:hypothetical protein